MSNAILILGESGTGKSTSLRTLDPESTFILNVIGKPLPFRGYKRMYKSLSPDGLSGNYYATDDPISILRLIKVINNKRPDIKHLILDDFGYTFTNSFMRKINQRGYDKYSDIGKEAFDIFDMISNLRDDLFCFVMMHTDIDHHGRYKPKTIGKLTDNYICIEGKFTYVFHALVSEGNYRFLTNNDNQHTAKSSEGMFTDLYIPNDLQLIVDTIKAYDE